MADDARNFNNSTSSILPLSTALERSQYQKTINEILERSDVEFVGGKRIVKRSGWRKLAFAFNVSFEMRCVLIFFYLVALVKPVDIAAGLKISNVTGKV